MKLSLLLFALSQQVQIHASHISDSSLVILLPKQILQATGFNYSNLLNLGMELFPAPIELYTIEMNRYNMMSATLQELFDVEFEQVYSVKPIRDFNSDVPLTQSQVPWHLDRIDQRHLPLDNKFLFNASGSCHTNDNVDIETVVVDTGVSSDHPEFEGNQPTLLENFSGDGIDKDCNSHGTFCSSQIGGKSVGVCRGAKLYAVKVLTCEGQGSTTGVISGMNYVFNRHVKNEKRNPKLRTIMSMSLGGGKSVAMNRVVEAMIKKSNTFYITVASGNENQSGCLVSPGSAKGVFSVNAMGRDDQRAFFSNYGECTDLYAPGVDNYGAVLNGKYAVESGTSFSTPIVAGVMNHYLNRFPNLNMRQLKQKILGDATKDTIKGNKENTPNLLVYIPDLSSEKRTVLEL